MHLTRISLGNWFLNFKIGQKGTGYSVIRQKKAAKKISDYPQMINKINESILYCCYGNVYNNYTHSDPAMATAVPKQVLHLFFFFSSNSFLDDTNSIKEIKDGWIANATTKNPYLRKTFHYKTDGTVVECPNPSKNNSYTVFESIKNFESKKIGLKNIEMISLVLLNNNQNLKTRFLKGLGNDENEIKQKLITEGWFLDLD